MKEHLPERPSWDCTSCGQAWPCTQAKTNLAWEYRGNHSALLVYLGMRYWEALNDFDEVPIDLDERFLRWVR